MTKRFISLFILLVLPLPLFAQRDNTYYVRAFETRDVRTVGAMTAKAQAACDKNTSIPCVIIFDPTLAVYPVGTMPDKCLQCTWIDFRSPNQPYDQAHVYRAELFPTIQAAIDRARANGGGIVRIPKGDFYADQIVWKFGVSIECASMAVSSGGGTRLHQNPGVNKDFIVTDPAIPTTDDQHWTYFRNCSLDSTGNTIGNGIAINSRSGEGFQLERLVLNGFPNSCIKSNHGTQPLYSDNVHPFNCGEYGWDLTKTGSDPMNIAVINHLSGDNNGIALMRIKVLSGTGSGDAVAVYNVKAEKSAVGKQNYVFDFDTTNATPVSVFGLSLLNTTADPVTAVARVKGSSAAFAIYDWSAQNTTNFLDDQFNAWTVPINLGLLPSGGLTSKCVSKWCDFDGKQIAKTLVDFQLALSGRVLSDTLPHWQFDGSGLKLSDGTNGPICGPYLDRSIGVNQVVFTDCAGTPIGMNAARVTSAGAQAQAGFVRMLSSDQMCWRNNANSGNVCDSKDTNDVRKFGGNGIMPPTFTFGTLPSGAPNGSMVYCSDCTIAASCAASGTGAFAKRLNGAWVCN